MKVNFKYISTFAILGMLLFASCVKSDDSPGYEYVPDMYRSQAIEAYVDYGLVKDDERSEEAIIRKNTISARKPAYGSIPYKTDIDEAELLMPYQYENTNEGYEASDKNNIPSVFLDDIEGNIKEGKRLYNIMCQHCHGTKGQGDGGVVEVGEFNPPSPYDGAYKNRSLGKIFHVITYGKGAMGPHASQLDKVERWKVAMYVRTLQHGGDFKLNELLGAKEEVTFSEITEEDISKLDKGNKISLRNVYFNTGSSELTNESTEELSKLIKIMETVPTMTIQISGHTDNTGEENSNLILSESRAKSVVNYMINKGVTPSRMTAKGYGSEFPVADNSIEQGKKLNRRIEFEILSK